jgi:hypothetical protein
VVYSPAQCSSSSRLLYHQKCVKAIEAELVLIANFPDVVGVDAEGNFVTHSSTESLNIIGLTNWAHGIKLFLPIRLISFSCPIADSHCR